MIPVTDPIASAMRMVKAAKAKAMRKKVEDLENALCAVPQVDCPVRHHFAPGVYAREITIPAGTVVVGAVHKRENLAIISAGRLLIVTDDGTVEISAPHILKVMPGQKHCVTALEDSVWTNFFSTEETDVDKLCELLTESKSSEMIGGIANKQLLAIASSQEQEVRKCLSE